MKMQLFLFVIWVTTFTIVEGENLAIQLKGPRKGNMLAEAEFIIEIENKSNKIIRDVHALLFPATGFKYIASDGNYHSRNNEEAATLRWFLDKVEPGEKIKKKAIFEMARGCYAISDNVLEVIYENLRITDSISISIRGAIGCCTAPHVSGYDTEDPAQIGSEIVYVLTFRNQVMGSMNNIYLKAKMSEEIEFVKAELANAEKPLNYIYNRWKHEIRFSEVMLLPEGESLIYKVTCRAKNAGIAKLTVIAAYEPYPFEVIDIEETVIIE